MFGTVYIITNTLVTINGGPRSFLLTSKKQRDVSTSNNSTPVKASKSAGCDTRRRCVPGRAAGACVPGRAGACGRVGACTCIVIVVIVVVVIVIVVIVVINQ